MLGRATSQAWLEFRELGQQITIAAPAGAEVVDLSQPLRFASHWVHVTGGTVIRIAPADADVRRTTFTVVPHCKKKSVPARWLARLGAADAAIAASHDQASLHDVIATLDTLARSAPAPDDAALVTHYRALAAFSLNRMDEAIATFRSAERAWLRLGEPRRALAARVGWIEAEDYDRRYPEAIAATRRAPERLRAVPYFSARIANVRCRSYDEQGQLDEARACYQDVLARYRRLHEMNDYAATLQNLANVERKSGRMEAARALAADGLKAVSGPYAPMIRGRLYSLLAALDRQTGNIATAFHDTQLADVEFRHAGVDSLTRRAFARLYEAMLLEETGAYYEAYSGLASVWKFLAPANAPRVVAEGAQIFAELERDTHHPDQALLWMRVSEAMSERLGITPLHAVTRLARLQLQLERGDLDAVEHGLAEPHVDLPLYEPQWRLLEAGLDVRRNRFESAQRALDAARAAALTLPEQIQLALIDAELHERNDDAAGAQRILRDRAARVRELARRASSRTLQFVIDRQTAPLRRAGVSMALVDNAGAARKIDAAWPWLGIPERAVSGSTRPRDGAAAERFDRAAAAELLRPMPSAPAPDETASERELLSLFGTTTAVADHAAVRTAPLPLAALQQSLDADSAFVAFLDGGSRGAVLWVTRDDVRLFDTAPPERLRTSTALLLDLLASADSPVAEIRHAARKLSAQLLGRMPPGPPPRHLFVRAGELMARVAWSALPWPGRRQPLIDSTDVRQVLLTTDAERTPGGAAPVHVFVAAQDSSAGALPALAVAGAEPRLIRAAVGARKVTVAAGDAATRDALLAALRQPGAWVHVAAHGAAQPERLGYAGLWLEPAQAGAMPQFLSWLDILDRGVGADLVVLDACRLGDSGNAIDGNLSFAAAVARAGARQVVAALWPISDAAAALWVPAFYAELNSDPRHDAAQALRAAQLRLRASREFRHPFYWAGMQSIDRLAAAAMHPAQAKAPPSH